MDIHSVREELKHKSVYDIPLRVTYYARVSSDSDEQLNSLDNQISYYENFIRKINAWKFVPGYIDEGLSGISTKKRENFNRMIEDSQDGVFDLIVTKEISRFARNTLDSLQYTRELLSNGVGVFFQNDNINTLDEDSELRLSIMSSIAQDELRKLSSRVKFGHQQAIKSSVVLGNNNMFGYRKENKHLVIDEAEAEMIREVYELYATGNYSFKQIENVLWDKGYRNHNGNKIAHSTLSAILTNPKYKGYYCGNKVRVIDMFTKKQKFLPPEEWVMFKDESGEIVPAIVSEELWETANEIWIRRSKDVRTRQGICNTKNLLTGKLYCTECGSPFYRRDSKDKQGNSNSRWVCSGKIKNGKDSCSSEGIYEKEIVPILFDVFKDTKADAEALADEYMRMYLEVNQDDSVSKKITALKKQIEKIQRKKQKLLEMMLDEKLSEDNFTQMTEQCTEEMKTAENELSELEQVMDKSNELKSHIDNIRSVLSQAQEAAADGIITKEFVEKYIDKIYVDHIAKGQMRLSIKIFTGETTERYLNKLKHQSSEIEKRKKQAKSRVSGTSDDNVHSGITFKKMIESYEKNMK